MATLAHFAEAPVLAVRRADAFEYQHRPRAGFNWAYVEAVSFNLIIWSSVALSAAFWGAVLFLVLR